MLTVAAMLVAQVATAPAAVCERLCLAPVETVGLDGDERLALEAALVRALDAPRCSAVITVDDTCFDDDACLAQRGSYVVVRAVRGGPELRLTWAAVKDGTVTRGEHVASAIPFFASGALPAEIARGACTEAPAAAPAAPATATPAVVAQPPAPAASSGLPVLALVGGGVSAASLLALGAAAVTLESAATPGAAKEVAFVGGWVSAAGVVVGAALAAAGLLYEPPSDR